MIEKILKDIDDKECYYVGTNGCLYQDLEKEKLYAIKQEIERLKAREKECIDKYLNMSKYASEMEGKYITEKYIIDELEKYIKEEIIEGNKRPEDYKRYGLEDYVKGQLTAYNHILDKLKELKENK